MAMSVHSTNALGLATELVVRKILICCKHAQSHFATRK